MQRKKIRFFGLALVLCGLLLLFRGGPAAARLAESALVGGDPAWLADWAHSFYPSLASEYKRLGMAFFADKASGLAGRWGIVCVFFGFLLLLRKGFPFFWENKLFQIKETYTDAAFFPTFYRILFFVGLLFYSREFYSDFPDRLALAAFYAPQGMFALLALPFPSPFFAYSAIAVFYGCCLLCLIGYRPVLFSALAGGLFLYLQGLAYCFEKIDHTYATLGYGLMLMPFLLLAPGKGHFNLWPLLAIRSAVVLAYFFSGLEKLSVSGLAWADTETFRAYVAMAGTPAGAWLLKQGILCYGFPKLALALQIAFPLVLFSAKSRWLLLPAGLFFHWGTLFFLGAGGLLHPWVFMYMFFLRKRIKIYRQAASFGFGKKLSRAFRAFL